MTAITVRKKADLVIDATRVTIVPDTNKELLQLKFEVPNQGESVAEKVQIKLALKLPDEEEEQSIILPRKEPYYITITENNSYTIGGIKIPVNIEYLDIIVDPEEIIDEETHRNNRYRYEPN